jgi:hypothetical protein
VTLEAGAGRKTDPTISILRTLLALFVVGTVIALTSCGGSSQSPASEPQLPSAIANDLAGKSDQIADALEGGDECSAAQLADELKSAVDAAIAGGQIPPAFQNELERVAIELQNNLSCHEEKGEHGEDKGKKKGHDDATTSTSTTTLSTTTEEGG